jgi:choline-sulfatase
MVLPVQGRGVPPASREYDHVVLISLDTLRSDGIAANPYKLWPRKYDVDVELRTPVLDDVFRASASFVNCIAAAPYTSAAHASILTGKWPAHHGLLEFFNRKLRGTTLFTIARRLGFRTYLKSDFPIILGPFLGFTADVDEYVVEEEDEYLERLDVDTPSFSLVHFGGLHIPYGFHNLRFGGADYVRRVEELEQSVDTPHEPFADQLVETFRSAEDLALLLRYKHVVQYHYERERYDLLFSLYLEGINHFLQHRFAPFFERLTERLRGRRALFVLFGDHGEEYDSAAYGHFNSLAEGAIRVPVLFYGEHVRPAVHATRMRSVDMAPTILSALGVTPPSALDGVSLAGTVWGDEDYPTRPAFAQVYTSDTREFVAFQKRLLERGRKTGALQHVCYLEGVYDGDYKLRRQNYRYRAVEDLWQLRPCPPELTLERIEPDLTLTSVEDGERASKLLALLDSYVRTGRVEEGEEVEVPDDVRTQLLAMGYSV